MCDRGGSVSSSVTDAAIPLAKARAAWPPSSAGSAASSMECVVAHPALQGLRRMALATRDAHGLYARFGFHAPRNPSTWMEIHDPDVYVRGLAAPQGLEAEARPGVPQESHAR